MTRLPFAAPAYALLPLLLAAPLPAQAADLHERVARALDDARPVLLAQLGDLAAPRRPSRAGLLALVVLAAVHDGVDAAEPTFAVALQRLVRAEPDDTYDLAVRLMVIEACAAYPNREAAARADGKRLLQHRASGGAFSYHEGAVRWDLSNTQYAALGLRAAAALGVPIDRSVWRELAATVGGEQDSYGGFCYGARSEVREVPRGRGPGPRDTGSYASMTAAGIAVLAICRQALGEQRGGVELQQRIARGWQWFAKNADAIGSPDERWSLYFHYGLERAAILCDVTEVAGRDWYAQGAEMLCRLQLPGGGWRNAADLHGGLGAGFGGARNGGADATSTAFAVLFLRRKFQKVAGPITPHVVALAALGPRASAADVAACVAELERRGREAMPDVLRALRSDAEPQRRAAAQALAAIAGERFGYDPALNAEANRPAIAKAELWYLKNR